MIKLITDGGLPHPAKCCSCGYGGNERYYFWFKYKERWGQVLICTTCMTEAAMLQATDFVPMPMYKMLCADNDRLQEENDRLEQRLTLLSGFDKLIADFVASSAADRYVTEPEDVVTEAQWDAINELTVETGAFDNELAESAERGTPVLDSLN